MDRSIFNSEGGLHVYKNSWGMVFVLMMLVGHSPATQAITYGEPDEGRHPYVGLALFFVDGRPTAPCSGTLISPTVFLTAGHCVYDMDYALVWFDEQVERDFPPPPIFGTPIPHPRFDPTFASFPDTSDVGAVILDQPVVLDVYGQLPELGALDRLATRRGHENQRFTIVGYGLGVIGPHSPLTPPAVIERRTATSKLINLRNALTDGYNIQMSGDPGRGGGGICFGDSGGPILMDGSDIVVAIASLGLNRICRGPSLDYRTDIANTQDFIQQLFE
jgi:hypothetical protein